MERGQGGEREFFGQTPEGHAARQRDAERAKLAAADGAIRTDAVLEREVLGGATVEEHAALVAEAQRRDEIDLQHARNAAEAAAKSNEEEGQKAA